jgi:fused signal recognition particle receptor
MVFWRSKSQQPDQPGDAPKASSPRPSSGTGDAAEKGGLLALMRSGLQKTRAVLNTDIRDLFKGDGRLVDETLLEELFSRLIRTDMGFGPATEIRDRIAKD